MQEPASQPSSRVVSLAGERMEGEGGMGMVFARGRVHADEVMQEPDRSGQKLKDSRMLTLHPKVLEL